MATRALALRRASRCIHSAVRPYPMATTIAATARTAIDGSAGSLPRGTAGLQCAQRRHFSLPSTTTEPLPLRRTLGRGLGLGLRRSGPFRVMSSLPAHEVVGLPALSPTMEVGTISEWKVKEGGSFAPGDVICLVETDKATVDFEAQEDGIIAKILVPAGTPDVKVGQPIMVLVESADSVAAFADFSTGSASPADAPEAAPTPAPAPAAAEPTPPPPPAPAAAASSPPAGRSDGSGRVFASPLSKALAREKGVDLSEVTGTGPLGRVIAADVKEFVPSLAKAEAPAPAAEALSAAAEAKSPKKAQAAASPAGLSGGAGVAGQGFVDLPVSEEAREIAARMATTMQTVPHYYLSVDVKLDKILAMRAQLLATLGEKSTLSLNDMLVKAAALAMRKVPDVNASWMETFVRRYDRCDVNLLVGVGDGVVLPLLKDVGRRGLGSIATEAATLAAAAKEGTLDEESCATGTFTVANLGAYGVRSFAPIVNAPQACMLALGAAEERVIPNEDVNSEEIYQLTTMLTATLSCDHRVVDGAVGAQWLQAYKTLVENPITMIL